MLGAMLIMLAACWLYSVAVVLMRVRCIIVEREQNAAMGDRRSSQIMNWSEFFSMGGYGFYVWGSYLLRLS